MVATFSFRSATALAMEFWLARNSSDLGFILLWSIVILIVRASALLWGAALAGCPSGKRYEHIHVRFASAIHGLRDSRKGILPAPCLTLGAGRLGNCAFRRASFESVSDFRAKFYLFRNSSRPISIRRISDVPAPIS